MLLVRYRFRRYSTAQWATENPVLLDGEPGWDSTLKQFKVGNGVDNWVNLPFYAAGGGGGGGGATNLDGLTDVVVSSPSNGQIIRYNGVNWVNADGSTVFQAHDSELDALSAIDGTNYGHGFLTLVDDAALTNRVVAASTTVQGKVELATNTEGITGTDTTRAMTPASSKAAVDTGRAALGIRLRITINSDGTWDARSARTTAAGGYIGPVDWDSASYIGAVQPPTMANGDRWLERVAG